MNLETDDWHWQEIFESLHNGVVVINRNKDVIVFNKAAATVLNIPQAQVIGAQIEQVISNTRLVQVMETGTKELNQRIEINGMEIVSNRSPIRRGKEIIGAVAIFQDIAELEDLSHKLDTFKAINKSLDDVIESLDDGIVVANAQGIIVRANGAYQQMTGITVKEFVGKHVRDLLKQGYMNKSVTEMVLERRSKVNVMDIRNGKDLLMSGNPVFDENGNISHVVTAVRDVSQLNELKGKLAESEQIRDKYLYELEQLRSRQSFQKIITKDPVMQKKLDMAYYVANVDSNVLILGETGVGKELIAQLIHRASKRAKQPFMKINCGAIPSNLLESEFFGYESGAFTGALKEGKAGLFELAQGGTIFLDEVGELSLDLQVKVLRAIQDKEITRIGGKKPILLDVRIVAATNRQLEDMVRKKEFREDLYYRLNVVPIHIPPLRDRKADILSLVAEFLGRFNLKYGFQKWIHPDVMDVFLEHDWPGNIRELENTIERLVVTQREDCIGINALAETSLRSLKPTTGDITSLEAYLEGEECRVIAEAYRKTGSTRKAAAMLKISQSSMVNKMRKYKIEAKSFKE
ncbi:sigma-54 interaction domain-containing protein [Desulfosporosinus youngiae]|uniref:HTH-type transcriptional regulatory protein TyrR n=1 Tax=Desulfosporosinus youngiae DSM 17734 TaxID=768710 RepID=H5XVZ9_9FIRM|nr:sigma 54-interacting transcriptional regulator [Desulfosporosinus youngiae]EHQ90451.1 PAS domain S-box [Desulfosporosinus youngiae DSM 17734]